MTPHITPVPGLPTLSWTGERSSARFDPDSAALVLTAEPGTDWSIDALGGPRNDAASALVFEVDGDFALSARVVVDFRSTFDAGVLCLWGGPDVWAKLCFERSPQGQVMVVSVVTNGFSDDCNSTIVEGGFVHLRVSRIGDAYAFHSSTDGLRWAFVRLFRLADGSDDIRAGFLAQAPMGDSCAATFTDIRLMDAAPADLRDGS